jgi:predicted secreted protein
MEKDMRSKKIVFVSHCLLNANSKYEGTAKYEASVVPIADFFQENRIGIEQMPCPELGLFEISRKPATKEIFDTPEYRKVCSSYANFMSRLMGKYRKAGYKILAVIGVGGSTSCGSEFIHVGKTEKEIRRVPGTGIFMEELKKVITDVPFVDYDLREPKISMKNLEKAVKMSDITV